VQNEKPTKGVTQLRFGKGFEAGLAVGDSLNVSQIELAIRLPHSKMPRNIRV
jgi:hypothetical protein